MSPIQAAISIVCDDMGADGWQGFEDLTLLGLAWLLAALPPDLTVAQFADELRRRYGGCA